MGDNGLWCITNDIHGLPPCVVRGKHTDFCDGFERRWVTDDSLSQLAPGVGDYWKQAVWTLELVDEHGKVLPKMPPRSKAKQKPARECPGCLPRKAEHGLLCWSCWEKTQAAMNMAVDMVTHLASVDRAQQIDGAGIRGGSGWVLPVPATWRLADEMLVLLGHPEPGLPTNATVWEVEAIVERFFDAIDVELWVATRKGAEAAVRFYLAMQFAMRQHPMAEYEHQVRNVRCPKCKHRSLLWKPPLAEEGEVEVVCSNKACGRVMDPAAYDEIARIEETIQRQARVDAGGVPRPIPPAPNPDDDDVEPVCADDWELRHGALPPIWRKKRPVKETCVDCGRITEEGIYDRRPPREEPDAEPAAETERAAS